MQFGSVLLHSGTETQMNIKPTVSYATNAAYLRKCGIDTSK